ncbi:purine permease 21-like [Mercurialis annua]|uniref:purine permease 21-like n=1 Tax=Mercurialis annua TaxID=3986 RepID=UPI00215F2C08|nr:purine permease 21-like [Mercurialis annua]
MGEAQELQLQIMGQQSKEADTPETANPTTTQPKRNYNQWIRISIYIICLLSGQSVAVILGRLYFVKGGASKWLATLVQLAGFPILIPYYFITTSKKPPTTNNETNMKPPSTLKLAGIYASIGLLVAADCYLYSIGLQYLPVSTYTLICSSQLAFNSFFSYFLNNQKFTPFIINSLFLLTISSVLLVFNNESEDPSGGSSKVKYVIGFICTVAASAGYGLVMSLTQLAFRKVIKTETFKTIIDMIVGQQTVATAVILVGLFGSGEWNDLSKEMNGYQLGKVSYVMNLVWTCIVWQVYSIGCVGLISEVSSLFSNAISVVGLPIVPILGLFVFHETMDGVKAVSLVLAVWGFLSYVYQQYLDHQEMKGNRQEMKDDNRNVKSSDTVISRND